MLHKYTMEHPYYDQSSRVYPTPKKARIADVLSTVGSPDCFNVC